MAFQSVPNTVEAVVRLTINLEVVTLTFYGLFPGGYGAAEVQDLAEAVDDWAGTVFRTFMSTSANYDGTLARGLELVNDFSYLAIAGIGAGSVVSAPPPNNVCKAFKRRSAFTGRSARGRVYVPITQSNIDTNENYVTAGFAAAMSLALDEVSVYMSAIGATEVIVSRYTANAPRPTGITFPVVGYSATDLTVDSRRDRLP